MRRTFHREPHLPRHRLSASDPATLQLPVSYQEVVRPAPPPQSPSRIRADKTAASGLASVRVSERQHQTDPVQNVSRVRMRDRARTRDTPSRVELGYPGSTSLVWAPVRDVAWACDVSMTGGRPDQVRQTGNRRKSGDHRRPTDRQTDMPEISDGDQRVAAYRRTRILTIPS